MSLLNHNFSKKMKVNIKSRLRFSQGIATSGRVVYVLTRGGESHRISTGIPVRKTEWDDTTGRLTDRPGDGRDGITAINRMINDDITSLHSIVERLDACGERYDLERVAKEFLATKSELTLAAFMRQEIRYKQLCDHPGTARNYATALKSFLAFCDGEEIAVRNVTPDLIEDYASWLAGKGVCNNSISFYMRALRAAYMRLVKEGLTMDRHPFANVYTGVDKTRKRAISEADLVRIKNLDLEGREPLCFVRDMFLLSFYMMGISFVDLAFLKKSDVAGKHIEYNRCKTGQRIRVAIVDKMWELFEKYRTDDDSPFLLPIITDPGKDARRQYQNKLQQANKYLKIIAREAGVSANLSTYTSRHTWASIAKAKNINISTISDALGHQNETTTRIYLSTLDNGHIDRANEIIIKNL